MYTKQNYTISTLGIGGTKGAVNTNLEKYKKFFLLFFYFFIKKIYENFLNFPK